MPQPDTFAARYRRWRITAQTLAYSAFVALAFTSTKAHGNVLLDPFMSREAQVTVSICSWIAYPALLVAAMGVYRGDRNADAPPSRDVAR